MHEKQRNSLPKTFYLIYNSLTDTTVCVKRNSPLHGVERQAVATYHMVGRKNSR